jgi:hypothetical protein
MKYAKIVHANVFQSVPKLVFLVWNYVYHLATLSLSVALFETVAC